MLNQLTQFFLAFSHPEVIIPLAILGYIWIERRVFFHAICLIMLSMIVNPALKSTFKVPLSPELAGDFALPSGHMQLAVILYGWLALNYKNKAFRSSMAAVVCAVAFGLMQAGYHNALDIIAAIAAGAAVLFAYNYCKARFAKRFAPLLMGFSALAMAYTAQMHRIPAHSWLAIYTLIGALSAQYLLQKSDANALQNNRNFIANMLATIIATAALFIINTVFANQNLPLFISQSGWALIGLAVISAPKLSQRITKLPKGA